MKQVSRWRIIQLATICWVVGGFLGFMIAKTYLRTEYITIYPSKTVMYWPGDLNDEPSPDTSYGPPVFVHGDSMTIKKLVAGPGVRLIPEADSSITVAVAVTSEHYDTLKLYWQNEWHDYRIGPDRKLKLIK